jgi:hypothetical protein
MEGTFTDLVRELKTLRKGRGLFVGQIGERVGPALRRACGVASGDGPAEIRRKVTEWLQNLASSLPEDLRVAVTAAFALERDVQMPFYQDRVRWAAEALHRDDRTVRRRIDEGIERIAELACSRGGLDAAADAAAGWHTVELRTFLVLDQPEPEAYELRRVVADRDRLSELDLAMTLTADPGRKPADESDLRIDIFAGGRIVERRMEAADRFGFVIALPRELHRGETHELFVRFRAAGGPIQPHYVCVPKHRCDLFDLRIRFDLNHLPKMIWRLIDAFQRDIDDPLPAGEVLPPDPAGEIHTTFRQLNPGHAYGARWSED